MEDNLKIKDTNKMNTINISEPWRVEYWTKRLNCSEHELKVAIIVVGNSVNAVKSYLAL